MRKIIFIMFLVILTIGFVNAACSGGVDLDINTFERTPGEETFKVVATANGNGECLNIAWDKEQLNKLLEENSPKEVTDKAITGDIELVSQKTKVPTNSYKEIPVYKMVKEDIWGSCNKSCHDGGYPVSPPEGYSIRNGLMGQCYCIYKDGTMGEVGSFGSRDFVDEIKVSFSGLPETYITSEEGSKEIGNKVKVSYKGSLIGDKWLELPQDYSPFKLNDGSHIFVLGDIGKAREVKDTLLNCLNNSESPEESQECLDNYNNDRTSLFSSNQLDEWVSEDKIVKNANFEGDNLIINKKIRATTWPQINLIIDAECAGIHWIKGQPEVSCPKDVEFVSGESKQVGFEVKNIADGKGAFSLNLDCNGISSSLSENNLLMEKEESKTLYGDLTTSTTKEKEFNCELSSHATKAPSQKDSCNFKVTVLPSTTTKEETGPETTSGTTGRVTDESPSDNNDNIFPYIIVGALVVGMGIFFFNKKRNKFSENSLNTNQSFCTNCGKTVNKDNKFCIHCGKKL